MASLNNNNNNKKEKEKPVNRGFERLLYENSALYEKDKSKFNDGIFQESSFKEALVDAIEATTKTDARVALDTIVREEIDTTIKLDRIHHKTAHHLTEEIMILIHSLLLVIEQEDRRDEYSNNLRKALKDYILTTIQENVYMAKNLNKPENAELNKIIEKELVVYRGKTDKEYTKEGVYLGCLPLQELLEDDKKYEKNKGVIIKGLYLMSINKNSIRKETETGATSAVNTSFVPDPALAASTSDTPFNLDEI